MSDFTFLLRDLAALLDAGAVSIQADKDLYDRRNKLIARKGEFLNQAQFQRATLRQENLEHLRPISHNKTN